MSAGSRSVQGIPGLWWKWLTLPFMVAAVVGALLYVAPADGFLYPHGARIVLLHVPCAWLSCVAYLMAGWHSVGCLRALRRTDWPSAAASDIRVAASMQLGLLFAALTTASGSIFSHLQWGMYWNWDPRQTSIVVIMLVFAAYLVLRGAVEAQEVRARIASVYALASVGPAMFLIWVVPRITSTLHGNANSAVIGGGLGADYRKVMYGLALPAFLLLYAWMYQLAVRVMVLEAREVEQ